MDVRRYMLYGLIAFLSILLLMEWVEFKKAATTVVPAPMAQTSTPPADLAVAVPSQPANADDSIPHPVMQAGGVPSIANTSSDTVSISTDTLQMTLDLNGGDIIAVSLPLHKSSLDQSDRPFQLIYNNEQLTYRAESGLIGANGTDSATEGRARYQSAATQYRMADDADQLIVDLRLEQANASVIKRFVFERGSYLVQQQYLVENRGEQPWSARLYAQIKRNSSKDPQLDSGGMGMAPYLGAAFYQPDEPYTKVDFDSMREKPFKADVQGGWLAMVQHYFLSAWVPAADQTYSYSTQVTNSGLNIARVIGPEVTIQAGQQGQINSAFYAGPKDQYSLEKISSGLELSVDYGFLWWIAQPLFWGLTQLHALFGNWGWAIIVLTVLIKAAFFGLNAKAYTSMANMRRVQPKLVELRERYADDRQKQSQAMMELYRKEKINPLGGCLPILVQMPVFISLYWVLLESVELRHAPWMLWIHDLSAMDPYFILPLLMGVSMFIQQKLNPPPPDPMQAKVMQWLPVIFTFFFLFFPAGLVLYWVVNNVLSIAQQWVITRRIEGNA